MEEKIAELISTLTKAIKALQIYGIDHPSFKNFYGPFYGKMSDFLKEYDELTFKIDRFTLLYQDIVVYKEEEKDISIAFRLFRDGIRNIGFSAGLTSNELLRFLEIIAQPSKDQDIALGLWESDFSHINFYVVEEDDELVDYKVPEKPIANIDYDAQISELINKEKIDIDTPLVPDLTDDELKALKTDILADENKSILPLTITTLINFLNIEKSEEIIDSLINLLEQCIATRDFHNARNVVLAVQKYSDVNVIEKLENETTILGFKNLVNTQEDKIFNEFIAFIGFFSKNSIPHFLKLMASVKRQDRLEALRQRIAYIAQDDVRLFANFLRDKDVTTLINAVTILGIMASEKTTALVKPLIHHTAPMVRVAVILAFEKLREPSMITQFIDDTNIDVRVKALQALTYIKHPRIYPVILDRVKSKDFLDLEFVEQKEYFNCLVANGDYDLVNVLKKILFKWLLFGRKRYRIMRKLAAAGLAQINSNEALEILRKGAKNNNKDIKLSCEMALREK